MAGGDALDVVALGLAHASQELACIAAEALHIAALPLGVEGVEGQRRLARARQAGDDYQPASRYLDVDVLQVVDAGAFYDDGICFAHVVSSLMTCEVTEKQIKPQYLTVFCQICPPSFCGACLSGGKALLFMVKNIAFWGGKHCFFQGKTLPVVEQNRACFGTGAWHFSRFALSLRPLCING